MFKRIDKIFCINLITSVNRKEVFMERFPELVGSGVFEWYTTERDNENPKRGCHNSHKNILELAKKRKYSEIIIFEDDANLMVPWKKFVNVVNDIKYPNDWKAIQLGYLPFTVSRIKDNETVVQINCSVTMHCYMANVKTLNIPEYKKGIEVDRVLFCPNYENYFLNRPTIGFYGIFPNILVKQNGDDSTISITRNFQGHYDYDRDSLMRISLMCNYTFTSVIIIVILSGFVMALIMYHVK